MAEPVYARLRALASQENCDGEPYDTMMEAADRLAQIERQVIYRTADMPEWADKWMKNEHGAWFCGLTRSGHAYGAPAPDYRPDEPGPLTLPIIDPPDGEG